MNFEWDDEKNKINFAKHGIDFETAMLVIMIFKELRFTIWSIVRKKIGIIQLVWLTM